MTTVFSEDPPSAEVQTLYAALGRFAVKFEHVCHAMASVITAILENDGLRNYKLAIAVLAGLTAEPLRRNLEAVLAEVITPHPSERAIVANILGRVTSLIQRRNDVIHRTWFIGWTDVEEPDFSRANGIKFRKGKQGASPDFLRYSVGEFDELSAEADELTALVRRMGNAIVSGHALTSQLEVAADGTVHIRSAS